MGGVSAIIAILAGLLLPALAKAKLKAQGIQCVNNHRQLTYAWLFYADDNRERFAYASPLNLGTYDPYAWVSGVMDFDANNRSNWDPQTSSAVRCGSIVASRQASSVVRLIGQP